MATHINVTVGGSELLERDMLQRQASRFDALQKQQNKQLEIRQEKKEAQPTDTRLAPLAYRRDPAANRNPGGAVMGVTYQLSVHNSTARTVKLKVGTPGFTASAERVDIFDPGMITVNDITVPASGSGGDTVEAPGGIHYYDGFYTNPYIVASGVDLSGVGTQPYLYTGAVPPPQSSVVDTWTGAYDTYTADKSTPLVIPAGGNNCLFIYIHNKLTSFNTFRRVRRRRQVLENPRTQAMAPSIGNGTWYDMRGTNTTVFELVETRPFLAYQIFAFLVTPIRVTEVPVPTELDALLRKLNPPLQLDQVSRVLESGGGQVSGYGPGSSSYFFSFTTTYQNVPGFDNAKWLARSAYGSVPTGNDVLAKQFGLGYLQYSSHGGRFFSPAVFTYLKGRLDLQASASRNYAAMKTVLNGSPPAKYLAPCVKTCSTQDTEFYVTRTMPSTTSASVPAANFQKDRRYIVPKGEVSSGTLYYCWDWDDSAFCRQQLASLGFGGLAFFR